MAKKNNTLLIVGIAAVGFYLWKRSAAAPVPVALPGSGLNPTLPTSPMVSAPAPAPAPTGFLSQTLQTLQQSAQTTASGTVIPADIHTWVNSISSAANQAQANKALAIMPQSEIDSLEDIVHNDFYGNGITTPAQRAFWDMWRTKYHVLDGTYA